MKHITSRTDLKINQFGSISIAPRTDDGKAKRGTDTLDNGNRTPNDSGKSTEPHARQYQLLKDGEGIRKNIEDQISRQSKPVAKGNSQAGSHPVANNSSDNKSTNQTAAKSTPGLEAPGEPLDFEGQKSVEREAGRSARSSGPRPSTSYNHALLSQITRHFGHLQQAQPHTPLFEGSSEEFYGDVGESHKVRHTPDAKPFYNFKGAISFFTAQAQTAKSSFSNPPLLERGAATQVIQGQLLDGSRFVLARSIVDYLSGDTNGTSLSPHVQRTLEQTVMFVGREAARSFVEKHGERAVALIERFITQATETTNPFARHNAASRPVMLDQSQTQRLVDQLTYVLQLSKQFDRLERIGGGIVRQAEAATIGFLCGGNTPGRQRPASAANLLAAAELRRDLCSGAFLPAYELHNPFPLTGRARIATEMMELMRTLDAIDRALRQLEALPRRVMTEGEGSGTFQTEPTSDSRSEELLEARGHGGEASEGEAEFSGTMPALPGRAGRDEMARCLRSPLDVLVTDASGEALLVAEDKTPLKLDQLLWHGNADGALGSAFETDEVATRLSPLLLYGFDAVYSLIGFDGRTLAAPHFATVQAQINGSEFEWVFGQPPLSEGWTRAMIEQLKDSISTEHNVLGEVLEEALTDGRLHTLVMRGAVEQGVAVHDSFAPERWEAVTPLAYL